MDIIFMNSENSRTSECHVLVVRSKIIRSKKRSKKRYFFKS